MLSQNDNFLEEIVYQKMLSPASFWRPNYTCDSAWLEHGPFAFWLVSIILPQTIVELGTHRGFSYFCFCQAIKAVGLDKSSSCSAVDTWKGDKHTGSYPDDVYLEVSSHNERHYSEFSSLLRVEFSEAVCRFRDESVDLLHLDGSHGYEDISTDWRTWLPKLKAGGVVLLHDIAEHKKDFGVHRFWHELASSHPHFEFGHGSGLGVICPKGVENNRLHALFGLPDSGKLLVRDAYSRLGSLCSLTRSSELQAEKLKWCEETMAWQAEKLKWCEETMAWQAEKLKST